MGSETETPARVDRPGDAGPSGNELKADAPEGDESRREPARDWDWFLLGPHGLRTGWSLAIFAVLYRLFSMILGMMAVGVYPPLARFDFSPGWELAAELVPFVAMMGAGAMVALFEHHSLAAFNLQGPRRGTRFLSGVRAGFLALSALVGALAAGGWLHFGAIGLSGAGVVKFGVLWGCAFLVVGCVEEGIFRCFLQSTLTRGINFWWALAIVAVLCLDLLLRSRGQAGIVTFIWMDTMGSVSGTGAWGVYAVALLGVLPCLALELRNAPGRGFWQAAWVTSTLFGFVHTGNNGENWIGIFAAAAIGFVFCVSIWVTGSAWWAIGCHAAWDWAETYFYGTADSGFASKGHFLTATPTGPALWSGGSDGPEGSLLVLGAILLLLATLLAMYGRRRAATRDYQEEERTV